MAGGEGDAQRGMLGRHTKHEPEPRESFGADGVQVKLCLEQELEEDLNVVCRGSTSASDWEVSSPPTPPNTCEQLKTERAVEWLSGMIHTVNSPSQ